MTCETTPPSKATVALPARRRCLAVLLALTALTVLRVVLAFHYRVDSDEPQHLHIVWGWAHGLVQFRDLSDNHAPLFHLVMTPFYLLLGDQPNMLIYMRLLMTGFYFLTLWATYALGRALYGVRTGRWAAALTALFPGFLLISSEFRADDLWMALWMAFLLVALRAPLTTRRAAAAGVLLGATFAASMKTLLLGSAFGLAVLIAWWALPASRRPRARDLLSGAGVMAATSLLVPLLIVIGFAFIRGGVAALYVGVIAQNLLPGLGNADAHLRWLLLPLLLPPLAWGARRIARAGAGTAGAGRRLVLLLLAVLAPLLLLGLWPLLTRQDPLPMYPALALALVAALPGFGAGEPQRSAPRRGARAVVLSVAVLELVVTLWQGQPWIDRTRANLALYDEVLTLTRPTDRVVDLKGELIFCRRATRAVLETITRDRIRRGLLPDTIEHDAIRTHAMVAQLDNWRFPPAGRAFLNANYLPVGRLRVAGKRLTLRDAGGATEARFRILLAGHYVFLDARGLVAGVLDGSRSSGIDYLKAGEHEFRPLRPTDGGLAVLWERAWRHDFTPFRQRGIPR